MDIGKIEYRVVPITRYQITRHYHDASGRTGGTEQRGEYNNHEVAYEVAVALCKAEHERLGWPVGDERVQYPRSPGEMNVSAGALLGGVVGKQFAPIAGGGADRFPLRTT